MPKRRTLAPILRVLSQDSPLFLLAGSATLSAQGPTYSHNRAGSVSTVQRGTLHPRRDVKVSFNPQLRHDRSGHTLPGLSAAAQARGASDTVFALSSGPGRAAIAVIRISGPQSLSIYRQLCPGKQDPVPRSAVVRTLYGPRQGISQERILDASAVVLFFPGPNSVTGEDVLELHVHGGPAIVKAVLAAIPSCAAESVSGDERLGGRLTLRYAEPGEFTKQAFYNQRLSLPQIEALGDSLAAETEQQRLLALRGSDERMTRTYESWRELLLQARGRMEAYLDFSEDQHLEGSQNDFIAAVCLHVKKLNSQLTAHLRDAVRGELLRDGIRVALLGPPNAGKSSLLNELVGRQAAIVSEEAGTTRDIVEVSVDIKGYLTIFGDTAGLRASCQEHKNYPSSSSQARIGAVEIEGMRRAIQRALDSDVVIVVFALPADASENRTVAMELTTVSEVLDVAMRCTEAGKQVLFVINKTDLLSPSDGDAEAADLLRSHRFVQHLQSEWSKRAARRAVDFIPISCIGDSCADSGGIQTLLDELANRFRKLTYPDEAVMAKDGQRLSPPAQFTPLDSSGTTRRQRLLLEQCQANLDSFLTATGSKEEPDFFKDPGVDLVIAAELLRSGADCLARITGRGMAGDIEEVLGVVFEKFCVGK